MSRWFLEVLWLRFVGDPTSEFVVTVHLTRREALDANARGPVGVIRKYVDWRAADKPAGMLSNPLRERVATVGREQR